MNSTIIILGTSRRNGNTARLVSKISKYSNISLINLSDYYIAEYDYEHKNKTDDFLPLITDVLQNYSQIIFATPVYWYSTSAKMKIFMDRLTDLLSIRTDIGRKLRGKKVGIITSSIGNNLGDAFWLPLTETFAYLGMKVCYKAHFYEDNIEEEALENIKELFSAPKQLDTEV